MNLLQWHDRHDRHDGERGAAMMMAIGVLLLTMLVTGAVVTSSMTSSRSSGQRAHRVVGLAPADSAISTYSLALQHQVADEATAFYLGQKQMQAYAGPGEIVLPSNSITTVPPVDPDVPHWARYTMREPVADGKFGFWQVYRIVPPDYAVRSHLAVYFRAWVGEASGASGSKPRLIRAEFRPGRFADYQMLTDGPIRFIAGSNINGPVHSNGFLNGMVVPPKKDVVVWNEGAIACGGNAKVTTANGKIDLPKACSPAEGTGRVINFLRVEDSFDRMRRACGNGVVICYLSPGPYSVALQGGSLAVSGPGGGQVSTATPKVLYFEGDVQVRGESRGRLTIASREPGGADGSGTITITGDTYTPFDTTTGVGTYPGDSLGLIAEGNIVVNPCSVSRVHAALLAESGALTLPPRWTTQMYQANPPACGAITVAGSVSGHRSPVLNWGWSNGARAGWSDRRYLWDRNLYFNPPPYFPLTDMWQAVRWGDANTDCLQGAGRSDSRCR